MGTPHIKGGISEKAVRGRREAGNDNMRGKGGEGGRRETRTGMGRAAGNESMRVEWRRETRTGMGNESMRVEWRRETRTGMGRAAGNESMRAGWRRDDKNRALGKRTSLSMQGGPWTSEQILFACIRNPNRVVQCDAIESGYSTRGSDTHLDGGGAALARPAARELREGAGRAAAGGAPWTAHNPR